MTEWNPISMLLTASGFPIGQFVPLLLMFAVVYLLVLRPMSTQERDRRKRIDSLKKGDQVVLAGGLLGRVSSLDDPKIAVIEIADRVKVRVLKREITDTQAEALKEESKGIFGGSNRSTPKPDDKASTTESKAESKAESKVADKASAKGANASAKASDKGSARAAGTEGQPDKSSSSSSSSSDKAPAGEVAKA